MNRDMGRRQRAVPAEGFCRPVSAERQAHLVQIHDRSALRQWAQEMGIADKVLELVISMVLERRRVYQPTQKPGDLFVCPKTLRLGQVPFFKTHRTNHLCGGILTWAIP